MSARWFFLVFGAIAFVIIFRVLRTRAMREKYAVLWLAVGLGGFVLAAFPEVLFAMSRLLGVKVPANLLFFGAAIVLLAMSVQFSVAISALEEKARTLAEEVADLRLEQEKRRGD